VGYIVSPLAGAGSAHSIVRKQTYVKTQMWHPAVAVGANALHDLRKTINDRIAAPQTRVV
jgi:hypothetical protein